MHLRVLRWKLLEHLTVLKVSPQSHILNGLLEILLHVVTNQCKAWLNDSLRTKKKTALFRRTFSQITIKSMPFSLYIAINPE